MAEEELIKVKVATVSTVAPAIPTVKHRMFLSNIDLALRSVKNMEMILFYETPALTTVTEFSGIVEKLKRSLSLVLVDFYPLAGRFDMREGESGRPELDCNDAGVEFVEASTDMAFQDAEKDDFQHKKFFKQLVRRRQQNYDVPLLSVQVTGFLGGGICIGANFHHAIVDGNAFWHFMNSWAECNRGLPISKNPQHMRMVFQQEKPENYAKSNISRIKKAQIDGIKKAQVFTCTWDDLLPIECPEIDASSGDTSMKNAHNSTMEEKVRLEISTFHFSERKIQSLKQRCGASTSSFVAVSAQFWRCVMKARQVPEEELVDFVVAADCRGRVKPPLPPTYFGNCVSSGVARTTGKQLLEQDIGFASALIQEAIRSCTSMNQVQMNNCLDWTESKKIFSQYTVVVSLSPKFPVYEIDYGWGRPVSVQAASLNEIGGMMLFAGREGKSIPVSTQLPHNQMETLKQILMI